MRRLPIAIALLLLPAASLASSFSEFRIPRHSWATWNIGGDGAAVKQRDDDEFGSNRMRDANGSLNSIAFWGLDSDELQWTSMVRGVATMYDRNNVRKSGDMNGEEQERGTLEFWAFEQKLRVHPVGSPLGFQVEGAGNATYNQVKRTRTVESIASEIERIDRDIDQHRYRIQLRGTATAGVGRVRDATGVYQARLLERRLDRLGALRRPLSRAARGQLAELFYVQPAYGEVHQRPDKYFWRDVERVLAADGVIENGTLDAFSAHLLLQATMPRMHPRRQIGFFAGPSISGVHQRAVDRATEIYTRTSSSGGVVLDREVYGDSRRFVSSADDWQPGAEADLHIPLNMRCQLDLTASARYDRGYSEDVLASAHARLTYLVDDRWIAEAGYDRDQRNANRSAHDQIYSASYSYASLAYMLEDAWQLGITYTDARDELSSIEGAPTQRRSHQSIQFGVTYRLLGFLDAFAARDAHHLLGPRDDDWDD